MKIKITASIFALTTFTVFAQQSLPTTNSYIVPIANPYSGSWIYYTTNPASGLGFLNGASASDLLTASNSLASLATGVTNGLASTNYVNAATSGLASTTFVLNMGQNLTNYVNAATNGFVTAGITNGLATTSFVLSQGYVTGSVTNGLATTNYVNATALSAGPGGNTDGQLVTNLQNVTWGTTTNKPAGILPPAKVYYYFNNGAPMFGIISTN